jgi:hypothetical protein
MFVYIVDDLPMHEFISANHIAQQQYKIKILIIILRNVICKYIYLTLFKINFVFLNFTTLR